MSQNSSQTVYIIVNAIPPYGYEINQFLACPVGTKNVVRFKKKWISKIDNADSLLGGNGILILRDWNSARLIPLRRLRISSVLPVGEIYDIEWLAGEIIEYDSEVNKRNQQLDKFNKYMDTLLKNYPNNPRSDLGNLVFLVETDITKDIKDSKENELSLEHHRWGKVVDIIGRLDCFLDIDFIKILGIQDVRGRSRSLVNSGYSKEKRYLLDSTQNYLLTIYQRTFTKKPRGDSSVLSRTIVLKSDTELIKIIDGESQISGKYGGHRFGFKTRTLRQSVDTYIKFQINRDDGKNVPYIHIPVHIKTSSWLIFLRAISLIFFIFGTICLFFAALIFPDNTELVRNICILTMIISGWETKNIFCSFIKQIHKFTST